MIPDKNRPDDPTASLVLPQPTNPALLIRLSFQRTDLKPRANALIEHLKADHRDAASYLDLSLILQFYGLRAPALQCHEKAMALSRLYLFPAKSERLRLLVLATSGDISVNMPIELILEDSDVTLIKLYILNDEELPKIPEHDIAIVAVCESDRTLSVLERLAKITDSWPHPVLNHPARIFPLARNRLYQKFQSTPGISIPVTARVTRDQLRSLATGQSSLRDILSDGVFPIIIRPIGSHGCRGLKKISDAASLENSLQDETIDEFYVSRFIDYRSEDGFYRKYRIAFIRGQPFLCHLAISREWMVNYVSAEMDRDPEKREEEARAMAAFDEDFGGRHREALRIFAERVDLDYVVIDCAETHEGELLIFEADISAVIHAMDSPAIYPYKHVQMRKVFAAFREMLFARARLGK